MLMANTSATLQASGTTDRNIAVRDHDGPMTRLGRALTVCSVVGLLLLLACRFTALAGLLQLTESSFLASQSVLFGIIGGAYFLLPIHKQRHDLPLLLVVSTFSAIAIAVGITTQGGTTIADSLVISLAIFSLAYACPRVLRNQDYLWIFRTVLVFLLAHSLLTVWLAATGTQTFLGQSVGTASGRCISVFGPAGAFVTGLTFNSNTLAIYLIFAPCLLILLERSTKSPSRKLAMQVLFGAVLLHLGATLSRAALFTVSCAFALWLAIRKQSSPLPRAIFWALAAPFGTAILIGTVLASQDPSMVLRYRIWCDAVDSIARHPWGHGVSAWNLEYLPHSFFLGTMLNFGVAGLLALSSVIGLLIKNALPEVRNDSARQLILLTVLGAIFIHGSLEYFIGQPAHFANALFWLLLGYLGVENISPPDEPMINK